MAKLVAVAGHGANGVRRSHEATFRKTLFASTALVGVKRTADSGARRRLGFGRPALAMVSMIAAKSAEVSRISIAISVIPTASTQRPGRQIASASAISNPAQISWK